MKQPRRLRGNSRTKRFAWCRPAGGRNARSLVILGIGLSTLVRWISRDRDRRAADPPRAAGTDVMLELKRLRRENEIFRQERDILKRATAFFVREGSR